MSRSAIRAIDNSWDYEIENGLREYNKVKNTDLVFTSSFVDTTMYSEEYFNSHCDCCGDELFNSLEDVFLIEGGGLCSKCRRDMDYDFSKERVTTISKPLVGDKLVYHLNRGLSDSVNRGSQSEPMSLSGYITSITPKEDSRSTTAILNSIFIDEVRPAVDMSRIRANIDSLSLIQMIDSI